MAQDQDFRFLPRLLAPRQPQPRSPAATRVTRTNTNRRHMSGDHHGWPAETATLLVRAMDEILDTHRIDRVSTAR